MLQLRFTRLAAGDQRAGQTQEQSRFHYTRQLNQGGMDFFGLSHRTEPAIKDIVSLISTKGLSIFFAQANFRPQRFDALLQT